MPSSREFDVRYFDNLVLPYDRVTKELDPRPRIVDGENVYVTNGGKLALAPGLNTVGLEAFTVDKRPDRLVVYETLENPPKVYLLASFYNAGVWECKYLRLDATTPAWTSVGTLRDVQVSTRPHEFLAARGWCFIKSYPTSGGDKYGSVIFDGSGTSPVLRPWGIPGPTVAARRTNPAGWAASANSVTVNFGWKYVYCYVSATGQYSNRSPLETDPSVQPSDTGAFTNKKPKIQVQGHADTANIPSIAIFRTTDGGGTFYHLETIANTGAGTIEYEDNHRVPSTTNDPKTDMQLDTSNIAPSLTSNTVPPPVSAGKTIGTDPVEPSTPPAYFASRVWYSIGNRLYFSGQEEILNGVPEESFPNPNGIRGNYYLVRGQPRLLRDSREALLIVSSNEVLHTRGTDRATLSIKSLVKDIGAASGHPRAIASFRDAVFFLSSDLQVYGLVGDSAPVLLSEPLGNQLRNLITSSTEVAFEIFSRDGNVWLLVAVIDKTTPANTRVFVYDLRKEIWFTPWTKPIAAWAFGRLRESDPRLHLIVLTWDGSTSHLAVLDPSVYTDAGTPYAATLTTSLFTCPAGNHINALRQPALTPMLSYLLTERTKFPGDTDPVVEYRLDEFGGAFTVAPGEDPPFINQRSSYNVKWHPVQTTAVRTQVKISKSAANEPFELQNLGLVFQPEAGI